MSTMIEVNGCEDGDDDEQFTTLLNRPLFEFESKL